MDRSSDETIVGAKTPVHVRAQTDVPVDKVPTGIAGFDEITRGGLPRSRATLVCGGPGCGKTLFGMEFLVRGARDHGENGVFVAFEESALEVAQNAAALGFGVGALVADGRLRVDHVQLERSEIEETGEYDLEGLFLRIGHALDTIGGRRIVIDTIEALFASFESEGTLRAELRRLFRWLKDRQVTAIITAERGEGALTRHGLEEYVSDCVVLLDHRVDEERSTRRLRVVKYRGSGHDANEHPFLIGARGFSVLPLTSVRLEHAAPEARVSSGVPGLDAMLGGEGFFVGSSVLVSGTPGTGKSTLAAHFADSICRSGGRCTYFSFEESPAQILRNMRAVGLDLAPWLARDALRVHALRPSMRGLESHLLAIHQLVEEHRPAAVIVDPLSGLSQMGSPREVHSMLLRVIDYLKGAGVTSLYTDLVHSRQMLEGTGLWISSLIDTWLLLRDIELGGERNRGLYVLKSRGMPHSNQIREFLIGPGGIRLQDVYVGPEGVLTGSMRLAQEAREREARRAGRRELDAKRRGLERSRRVLAAQIAALQADLAAQEDEAERLDQEASEREARRSAERQAMARSRRAEPGVSEESEDGT